MASTATRGAACRYEVPDRCCGTRNGLGAFVPERKLIGEREERRALGLAGRQPPP